MDELKKSKLPAPAKSRFSAVPLFLISTLLTNLHRLPGFSKVAKLLRFVYGKSGWWKMLMRVRKAFVWFNALLGFYAVINIVGFSADNILAGIALMGQTYFEMVVSFFSTLFRWIYKFFDHFTPEPEPKGWFGSAPKKDPRWFKPSGWDIKPMHPNGLADPIIDLAKNQKFYNPLGSNTVESYWIPNWVWYLGITVVSISMLYGGYVLITDPTWVTTIKTWITGHLPNRFGGGGHIPAAPPAPPTTPTGPEILVNNPTPPLPPAPPVAPDTGLVNTLGNASSYVYNKITGLPRAVAHALNPYTYLPTVEQRGRALDLFMENQFNPNNADHRYYPFTSVNPFDSGLAKWKLALFGETPQAYVERMDTLRFATRIYEEIRVHPSAFPSGTMTPVTGLGIGINSPMPGFGVAETFHAIDLAQKLAALPTTPTGVHVELPNITDVNLSEVWSEKVVEPLMEAVATSSSVTLEQVKPYAKAYAEVTQIYPPNTSVDLVKNVVSTTNLQQTVAEAVVITGAVSTGAVVNVIGQTLLDAAENSAELVEVSPPLETEVVETTTESLEEEVENEVSSDDDSIATKVDYNDYFKEMVKDKEYTTVSRIDNLLGSFNSDLKYGIQKSVLNDGNTLLTDKEKEFLKQIADSHQITHDIWDKLKEPVFKEDVSNVKTSIYDNYLLIKNEQANPTFEHSITFNNYLKNVRYHFSQVNNILKGQLPLLEESTAGTSTSSSTTVIGTPATSRPFPQELPPVAGPSTQPASNTSEGWDF